MKALYLWDSEYPWDIRVDKTCTTLVENGWVVHLVCRNRRRQPLCESYRGMTIHRTSFLPRVFGRINDAYTFPLFLSPVWISRIVDVVRANKIDLIIVRDLPMALAAVGVGRIFDVPVVLDMAECYPELIRLKWRFEPFQLRNLIIRNPYLADVVERLVVSLVDHIFVMVSESRDRLIAMRCSEKKISIVSNTPPVEKFFSVAGCFPGTLERKRGRLIMLYVGLLNHSRGLETVIDSIREYVRERQDVYLAILGSGNAMEELAKRTSDFGLDDYIGFEGWIDNEMVPQFIASSDVCIVPHHRCSHWENTVPNKLFDYMAAGKAVLSSDVTPVKRIIDETTCGLTYKDFDTHDFCSALRKLNDSKLREEFGQNGQRAVRDHFNWAVDSSRMLAKLNEMVGK